MTFSATSNPAGHDHGESDNESHAHTSTIGSGDNASGTDGKKHNHEFDNRPQSKIVRFIVKVDQWSFYMFF